MPAYLLAFHGGPAAPETDDDNLTTDAWYEWMHGIADSIIDAGNPTRNSRTVKSDGTVADTEGDRISGYSIIGATDLEEALAIARTCPILAEGGTVEVSELVEFDDDEDEDDEEDEDEDDDSDDDDIEADDEDARP